MFLNGYCRKQNHHHIQKNSYKFRMLGSPQREGSNYVSVPSRQRFIASSAGASSSLPFSRRLFFFSSLQVSSYFLQPKLFLHKQTPEEAPPASQSKKPRRTLHHHPPASSPIHSSVFFKLRHTNCEKHERNVATLQRS